MEDCKHCQILRKAMEEIRVETFQKYINRKLTIEETLLSWSSIQAIAARALRATNGT